MKRSIYLAVLLLVFSSTSHAEDEVKISTKGGLKVSSGSYKFELGGRIMYDYNKAEGDEIGDEADVGDMRSDSISNVIDEDQFEIRRARIYVKGDIGGDWSFKSQFNLHESGVEDLYLRYKGLGKQAVVTIGNQKMPFMLEEMTSSKDISILERSAITERYALGREEGITLAGSLFKDSTYALGAYLQDRDGDTEKETGFAVRLTAAPIKSDSSLVHLGAAYQDIGGEDSFDAFGLELGGVYGPFHVQAEYADGDDGDDSIDGYYVQAGYVLTGESRPYKKGAFKRIKPKSKSGFGAWEVVARYEDGDGNWSDIEGGRVNGEAYTIGLNWYAHKNVRFGLNYTDGDYDSGDTRGVYVPAAGNTPARIAEQNVRLDGSELRLRAQLTF